MRTEYVEGVDPTAWLITISNKFITIPILQDLGWVILGRWHHYPVDGGEIVGRVVVLFLSVFLHVSGIPSVEVAEDDHEQDYTGDHPEGYFEPGRFGLSIQLSRVSDVHALLVFFGFGWRWDGR